MSEIYSTVEPTLTAWVGRNILGRDVVSPGAVQGLRSTLADDASEPAAGSVAPLLVHWLHFLPQHPMSQVGPDGHPRRGDFLPPVDLPRRMWAGGRLQFLRPLRVGAAITRRSTIAEVREKSGRTGRLVFVAVDHEIADEGGICIRERHDIVYRDMPAPDAPAPDPIAAPQSAQWRRRIVPDPVLLFRYSALTLNGHRIHYDQPYVTQVEGYPGLVVHGPLIATLLLHELAARHPGADVASFSFRAIRPIFDITPFSVCGSLGADGSASLFAADESGALCMEASAALREV
jgi:3-methylfumaryl-CoA hydratase